MSTNSRSRGPRSADPRLLFASLAAFAIGMSLAGCPGSLDDEAKYRVDGGAVTCDDAMPIFKASCLDSGCHNATDKYSDLDLETPGVVGRYKGIKTKGGGGAHQLVDPTDPSKSAIYTKTKSPAPFGLQMPMTGTKLTEAQQKCVLDWITKELATTGPTDSGTTDDTGGSDTAAMDSAGD
jgi:hypothetical protein